MGVDLEILLPNKLSDVSLETVRDAFQPLNGLFSKISDYYCEWFEFKPVAESWKDISEPGSYRPYHFGGPAGFTFNFAPRLLCIYHVTRFRHFCTQTRANKLLRNFACQAARIFSHNRAIYSPDCGLGDQIHDWASDGLSFTELEAALAELGPPAQTFSELDARHALTPKYYIDRFRDISGGGINPTAQTA
jgi:hypothetical protein